MLPMALLWPACSQSHSIGSFGFILLQALHTLHRIAAVSRAQKLHGCAKIIALNNELPTGPRVCSHDELSLSMPTSMRCTQQCRSQFAAQRGCNIGARVSHCPEAGPAEPESTNKPTPPDAPCWVYTGSFYGDCCRGVLSNRRHFRVECCKACVRE